MHTVHGLPEDIAPAVGRDGGSSFWPGVSRRRRWWLESVYLRAEAALATLGLVVTPSRAMKRYLVEGGMPSHRIAVVPSCVPVRRRAPRPLGVPATIGTVANLEWWNGTLHVRTLPFPGVEEPARLEIFGDGSERPALQKLALSCGVDATFHGHAADAAARLGSLDVFVLPSRAENFPIALLEAMSWALPSVATRVGGCTPEMVEPGETGLLVPPDDVDALAAALVGRVRHPEWSRRLGAAGCVAGGRTPRPGGRRQGDDGGVSRTVRVLHAIQGLETGGAERIVIALAAEASKAGHEVAVASPPGALQAELDGVRFEMPYVRRDVRKLPSAAVTLASIIRRWSPDALHCHQPTMGLVAALATGRGAWRPALVSVHGVQEEDYEQSGRAPFGCPAS